MKPTSHLIGSARVPANVRRESLSSLSREIGPCVYFIRTNDGLVKIGYTGNVGQRKRSFRVDWTNLLAVVPGTIDDEQSLHQRFAAHLARGQEYYHPAPEIIDHINEIRGRLHVPAV